MTHVANPSLAPRPLLHALAQNWWLLFVRGVCALLFGLVTFLWPGISLVTLVLLYGVYAFADGVLAITAAVTGGGPSSRWWLAVVGVLGIAIGILTFVWPSITAIALLICIASWAIATGVMQIIGAIKLRNEIDDEWLLIAAGMLSILFGFMMFTQSDAGALVLILVIGVFAILYGILLVWFSLRLRRHSTG